MTIDEQMTIHFRYTEAFKGDYENFPKPYVLSANEYDDLGLSKLEFSFSRNSDFRLDAIQEIVRSVQCFVNAEAASLVVLDVSDLTQLQGRLRFRTAEVAGYTLVETNSNVIKIGYRRPVDTRDICSLLSGNGLLILTTSGCSDICESGVVASLAASSRGGYVLWTRRLLKCFESCDGCLVIAFHENQGISPGLIFLRKASFAGFASEIGVFSEYGSEGSERFWVSEGDVGASGL